MVRDTRDIALNLYKLWRLPDGRYLAGVHVVRNERAQYIAQVYLARKDGAGGILTDLAKVLGAVGTSEAAMHVGREWALAHLPGIYQFPPEDLEIRLMRQPQLG